MVIQFVLGRLQNLLAKITTDFFFFNFAITVRQMYFSTESLHDIDKSDWLLYNDMFW